MIDIKKILKLPKLIHPNTFSVKMLRNRYDLLIDYLIKRELVKGFPNIVEIEVSSLCNLNCIMCARRNLRVEKNMEINLFKKVIDQVAGRAELAILHASGEPLLNPHIFEMIRYCKERRVGTWLSTNGMLLNKKKIRDILDSPLDGLVIAIDGFTKETYEKIRVGGSFGTVTSNTIKLLDMHTKKDHALW